MATRPLVPPILPALEIVRSVGGLLGLRPFKVVVRRRTWTGTPTGQRPPGPGVPGMTKTDVDTVLTNRAVDGSLQPVMVRQLKRSEVFASGGAYTSRDLRVGPITPTFLAGVVGTGIPAEGGGFDDTAFNPVPASVTELIWIVSSPNGTHGIPPGGVVCELKGEEAKAMSYYAILRSTGRVPT